MKKIIQRIINSLVRRMKIGGGKLVYCFFTCFPCTEKIAGIASNGVHYSDSAKAIFEALHRLAPEQKLVWVGPKDCIDHLPSYVRGVSGLRGLWELATAKVWIASYFIPLSIWRRPRQLFIETWHGGLGIKKIGNDNQMFAKRANPETMQITRNASFFLSNSEHLTGIYRNAFGYCGPVWKSGYPQNDLFFQDPVPFQAKVRQQFNLKPETCILLYAPTFRRVKGDARPYNLDFSRLLEILAEKNGRPWVAFVRLHPAMRGRDYAHLTHVQPPIYNVTDFPDMQQLVMGCDTMISDYSSCIFDGALRGIPCFLYAADYEDYRRERGVYYGFEELPFPWATTQKGLENEMHRYEHEKFAQRWEEFRRRTGLYEPGNAADTVAEWLLEALKKDYCDLPVAVQN